MMRHFLSSVVTKAVAGFVVGCALSMLPAPAQAQAPSGGGALGQGFGEKGQLVISGEDFLGFTKQNNAGWRMVIQPSVDYFVAPSISIGGVGAVILGNSSYKEVLVGARAGFNFNVTENIGAWARLGVAYDYANQVPGAVPPRSVSTTWITAYLPIAYHIVPHLFFGLGPYYNLKVAGDGNTGYGVSSMIGGWF